MKRLLVSLLVAIVAIGLAVSLVSAQPPDKLPEGPCVRVEFQKRYGGSGTCIKVDAVNKKSLVLSNNHVFAFQPGPGAPFPLADYPLAEVEVTDLDKVERWKAQAVAGDLDGDLSFVVVDAVLVAAVLANEDAPKGEKVWHKGMGSGGSTGEVLADLGYREPCARFAATLKAINGDSGSGIFDSKGLLVGVTCGRFGVDERAPLRGTQVSHVKLAWKRVRDQLPKDLRP